MFVPFPHVGGRTTPQYNTDKVAQRGPLLGGGGLACRSAGKSCKPVQSLPQGVTQEGLRNLGLGDAEIRNYFGNRKNKQGLTNKDGFIFHYYGTACSNGEGKCIDTKLTTCEGADTTPNQCTGGNHIKCCPTGTYTYQVSCASDDACTGEEYCAPTGAFLRGDGAPMAGRGVCKRCPPACVDYSSHLR